MPFLQRDRARIPTRQTHCSYSIKPVAVKAPSTLGQKQTRWRIGLKRNLWKRSRFLMGCELDATEVDNVHLRCAYHMLCCVAILGVWNHFDAMLGRRDHFPFNFFLRTTPVLERKQLLQGAMKV